MTIRFRIDEHNCLVATETGVTPEDETPSGLPKTESEIVATLDESPVLAMMLGRGFPLTREDYIMLNYLGEKTAADLGAEELADIPEMFQEE